MYSAISLCTEAQAHFVQDYAGLKQTILHLNSIKMLCMTLNGDLCPKVLQ